MPSAILLGSKPGAVAALLTLLRRGWDVREVVANAEEAAWLPKPSLHAVASRLGIRVVERQEALAAEGVDLVISYMCRHRVRAPTRDRGRIPLNFHAGPLPRYAGWAFYNVAILEDATEYGCTCHVMDDGFDTGPLVEVRRFPIDAKAETAVSLERRAQEEMLRLFEDVLARYESTGGLDATPQDPATLRYLDAKAFAALKEIPADADAATIDRIARAFWYPPYEMAWMRTASGTRVEVIPAIAKDGIARHLHAADLANALAITGTSLPAEKD